MHFFVGLTFWDVNLPATRQVHSKDRIHMFIMPSMLSVKSILLSWATITDFSCPFVRYAVTHRSSNHLLSRYSILSCSDFDLVGGIGKLLVGVKEALLLHTRGGVQQQGLQQDLGAPPPLSSSSSGRTLLGYRRDTRYFYNTRSPSKNLFVDGQSTFICKSKFKHFSSTTIFRRGSISMSNLLPSHVWRHLWGPSTCVTHQHFFWTCFSAIHLPITDVALWPFLITRKDIYFVIFIWAG